MARIVGRSLGSAVHVAFIGLIHNKRATDRALLVLIVAALALGFVLDVFGFVESYLLILYAIPIIVAGLFTTPLTVRCTGIAAVVLSVVADFFVGLSLLTDLLPFASFVIGVFLAVRVSVQRFAAITSYEEMSALYVATRQLGNALDPTATINTILDAAIDLTKCDGAGLAIVDGATGIVRFDYLRGFEPPAFLARTVALGEFPTGQVAQTGRDLVVVDLGTDPRWTNPLAAGEGDARGALFVSLNNSHGLLGVLTAWSRHKGHFTDAHHRLLGGLGETGVLAIAHTREIAGRERLEEQLRQSQKMEVVGQLAGGIAHDFNNLLTVIIGYGEILLGELPSTSPHFEPVEAILAAGESAASLTRQLLAFSRRQVLTPQDLDLNATIEATSRMLRRLIGEDIAFTTTYGSDLGLVRADTGQIEQILMNLAANARDAMSQVGTLVVSTTVVSFVKEDLASRPAAHPGPYVLLSVRDTGTGMDAATQVRIFEPFFTTKEIGKGTGLGLAAVYGIVLQSGGFIEVESALGSGTTFQIYLPRLERPASAEAMSVSRPLAPRGVETILVVDDETRLRRVTRLVLEGCGYTVLEAENGAEALRLVHEYVGTPEIDLILTDVVMPEMNGRELIERLSPRLPNARVLYMSGYTDDVMLRNGLVDADVILLQKPFSQLALGHAVRRVLDAA